MTHGPRRKPSFEATNGVLARCLIYAVIGEPSADVPRSVMRATLYRGSVARQSELVGSRVLAPVHVMP